MIVVSADLTLEVILFGISVLLLCITYRSVIGFRWLLRLSIAHHIIREIILFMHAHILKFLNWTAYKTVINFVLLLLLVRVLDTCRL